MRANPLPDTPRWCRIIRALAAGGDDCTIARRARCAVRHVAYVRAALAPAAPPAPPPPAWQRLADQLAAAIATAHDLDEQQTLRRALLWTRYTPWRSA